MEICPDDTREDVTFDVEIPCRRCLKLKITLVESTKALMILRQCMIPTRSWELSEGISVSCSISVTCTKRDLD